MTEVQERAENVEDGIVVGIDGSEFARQALHWAAAAARAFDRPLHVLRAWSITNAPRPDSWSPGYVPSFREFEDAVRAQIDQEVAAVVGSDPEVEVHRHPCHTNAVQALIDASKDAWLVVVGSRGLGGFAGLVLGSTSEQVIRHAHCPVTVVRH